MKNDARIIYYMIFTLVLVLGLTISASFLLADAWEQPIGDTPSGGFIRPVENESVDDAVSLTTRPVSVDGNFAVGMDSLFVDASAGRVGIGTNLPLVALDVNGPIQLGNFAILPTCAGNIKGAFAFNTSDNMPYVCTAGGWRVLHADINGDGRW